MKRYSDTHLKRSADENSQHVVGGKGEKGPQNSSRVIHERGSKFNFLPSPDSQITALDINRQERTLLYILLL